MRRPRRTSLRTRLVAFCIVIAAASIGTTAWIAASSTSSSIHDQYTADVAAAADVYDSLSDWAATHPSWSGAEPLIDRLAASTGDRITLTTTDGSIVLDSGGRSSLPADARPAAIVDPLDPPTLLGGTQLLGGIDARALGPFRLSDDELRGLRQQLSAAEQCYQATTAGPLPLTLEPNGHPRLGSGVDFDSTCLGYLPPDVATAGEQAAADALLPAAMACFGSAAQPIGDDWFITPGGVAAASTTDSDAAVPPSSVFLDSQDPAFLRLLVRAGDASDAVVQQCVRQVRANQLAGTVAPRVQLYLSGVAAQTVPGLSGEGIRKVALAGTLVLLVTVGLCLAAATSLRRPLAQLTAAVQATARGERSASLPARGTREMAELAVAVNDLSGQLVDAEQRRKDMISDIAHELRTPLSNIRGWLEAVDDGVVDPDHGLVGSLLDEAVLLQHLVDELQDLALADAGRLTVHPERIDLTELAGQVVGAHGAVASAKGLTLTTTSQGDAVVSADPMRVRQVLGNLVSNAVRYTDVGSVRVTVRQVAGGVAVEVADTGVGMAAEDLAHVLDRFWRAEKSRNRASGGSGLGLAITKSLVEAHGGTIHLASAPGVGTTVTVRLPDVVTVRSATSVPAR